jgi:hypothetical protein
MKKILVLCVLALSFSSVFSQSIVTTEKAWSNLRSDYWWSGNLSTEKIRFTSDTLIGAFWYKRVEQSTDDQFSWSFYGFIREDSLKRIYYRLDPVEPERMIYDFTIQVYDTVNIYTLNTLSSMLFLQPVTYYVASADSFLIGETFRKRFNLAFPEDTGYVFEQWIDSTGGMGGLLHNRSMYVGCDSYSLLCYEEGGIVKFQDPLFLTCYLVTGTEDQGPGSIRVTLLPNPVVDVSVLNVMTADPGEELYINLYDLTGRMIMTKPFIKELQIRRNDFLPGIYLYRINGKEGVPGSGSPYRMPTIKGKTLKPDRGHGEPPLCSVSTGIGQGVGGQPYCGL